MTNSTINNAIHAISIRFDLYIESRGTASHAICEKQTDDWHIVNIGKDNLQGLFNYLYHTYIAFPRFELIADSQIDMINERALAHWTMECEDYGYPVDESYFDDEPESTDVPKVEYIQNVKCPSCGAIIPEYGAWFEASGWHLEPRFCKCCGYSDEE